MLRQVTGRDEELLSRLTGERALYYAALAGRLPAPYFDAFVQRQGEELTAALFRVFGTWFAELGERSDPEELALFLDRSEKAEVTGKGIERLRLSGVRRVRKVPFLQFRGEGEHSPRVADCAELSRLREIYPLLTGEQLFAMPEFEEFYVTRMALCSGGLSRIRGIVEDGRVAACAQTLCEGERGAMLGMVVTHPDYRRRGLAGELLRSLCGELPGEIFLAAYSEGARRLYKKLGFVEIGEKTCLQFY